MATFLYRLGRFSFRRRWSVLGAWVALLVAVGIGALTLSGETTDSISIPGTEAQEAINLLEERFPEASADGAYANVVFAAPEGESLTDPDHQAAVTEVVERLQAAPLVATVTDPYQTQAISPDGRIGYARVTYTVQSMEMTEEAREALEEAPEPGRDAGLTVEIGGDAISPPFEQQLTEVIGLIVAAIVLAITFGSLVAAGLPLLTALLGIMISMSAVLIATGFVDLSSTTPTLALMLGLAVAIDYALFILSRYRHEITTGLSGEEAAGRAVGTAGSAVVFAGLTVVIALVGLSVVGIPILTEMGLAAAGAVAIAVLIALTLLPALAGFAGQRVLAGRIPGLRARDPEAEEAGKPNFGHRWAAFITRRPLPVLLLSVVGLVVLALPALDLRLGLPDDGNLGPETTQRRAYDLLSEGFGPGFNGPLTVAVDAAGTADPAAVVTAVSDSISALDGVISVSPPVFNQAGDTALLTVIPATAPASAETEELVHTIRDVSDGVAEDHGADLVVTGLTAVNIDISDVMADAMLPYLVLVVGLAFILLMLVFRSILVPLKATVGFLATVATTFGALVAVFQWGWLMEVFGVEETAPIISILPIFMIGVVFGLAMDYQVFLVTRMREEHVHGATPKDAIISGFTHGVRVVTAAAIIMIAVFAGFVFSDNSTIKTVGFALAFGVAVDAFVVRMTVVPAVMALLGRSAWWLPRWLDRVLPNVDVEGEKLRHRLETDHDNKAPEPELVHP